MKFIPELSDVFIGADASFLITNVVQQNPQDLYRD